MKRRNFLKWLGVGVPAVVVAPRLFSDLPLKPGSEHPEPITTTTKTITAVSRPMTASPSWA